MQTKGTVSINAQNIMPVIKKWLYSDKDIFLRELVSNGCDAIAKYKRLAASGETEAKDAYRVDVICDKVENTLKITDNGIGMTAEEIEKYIAQVAFSGAEDFLKQYKPEEGENGGIIGHFGMGFYSAFMVAKKVEIDTLSWQDGAEAVRWISEDGMEYTMEPSDRTEQGTTITLTLNEDEVEFMDRYTLKNVLEKYCAFMPVEIYLSAVEPPKEKKEGEEEKEEPAETPDLINNPQPLWMKKPSEVTEEEYKNFYRDVFHEYEEPLFWIHLNAEFPFNLKGILYFPKLKNEFTANEGVIKLYNNQVFVADNIKEVIPEFLMLLKGVIDCPDMPLNVSRSALQNDGYVKKMSGYITRKVADRLVSEFKDKRETFEKYWNDIHPFVKYGCIKDEKFYERVKDVLIYKTTDGRFLTMSEYGEKNFDGDKKTVYYTADEKRQASLIELYTSQGKDVVVLDTLIDNNFISFMEYAKDDAPKFMRVDADSEGLNDKDDAHDVDENVCEKFKKVFGDENIEVKLASFKTDELPAIVTVDEQSRRFTEMSRQWGGNFSMPEKRVLTLNAKHPLIRYLAGADEESELAGLLCEQILDTAEMGRQPLEADRMVAFLKRTNKLATMLVE